MANIMYGGTKEEMGRLLADAEKISGIKYDVSSYADIVDAIHVVQTEMGITGTTSKEASTTIQGSVSSMKAAWENFLGGMADPKQDFDTLVGNLIDSVVTVADNIVPRIEAMLPRLTSGISNVVSNLITYLPEILQTLLPAFIDGITQIFNGIVEVMPELMTVISDALPAIIEALSTILPQMLEVGLEMIITLAQGIIDSLPTLIPALVDIITKIANTLTDPEMLSKLIMVAIDLIITLAQGLINALPDLVAVIPQIIQNITMTLINLLPELIPVAIDMIVTIAMALTSAIPTLLSYLPQIFDAIIGAFIKVDWSEIGKNIIQGVIDGIKSMVANLGSMIEDVANGIKDKFKGLLGIASPSKVFKSFGKFIDQGLAMGITGNIDYVNSAINDLSDATSDFGISDASSTVLASSTMNNVGTQGIGSQSQKVNLEVGISSSIDNTAAMGLARYLLPFIKVAEKEAFA